MRDNGSGTAVNGVGLLSKAFQVLDQFTSEHPAWTQAELGRATGVSKSTINRLVRYFCERGYLTQQESKGPYQLGPAAVDLGLRASAQFNIGSTARPLLEELARDTGETALLAAYRPKGRLVLYASLAYAATLFAFGLAEHLWLGCVLIALVGAADAVTVTVRHSTVMLTTPDTMRGRAYALMILAAQTANNLGTLWIGFFAGSLGAPESRSKMVICDGKQPSARVKQSTSCCRMGSSALRICINRNRNSV